MGLPTRTGLVGLGRGQVRHRQHHASDQRCMCSDGEVRGIFLVVVRPTVCTDCPRSAKAEPLKAAVRTLQAFQGAAAVPLQAGYPVQPQNSPPALAPRWALRFTIGFEHLGQAGGGDDREAAAGFVGCAGDA
jgi:hypothetical protein